MSPNAWTEGVFPLLGGVEDKYKQKKTIDTEKHERSLTFISATAFYLVNSQEINI